MPRPRKVTQAMIRAAVDAINAGKGIEAVASEMGIHRSTLREYIRIAERDQKRTGKHGMVIRRVVAVNIPDATAAGMAAPAPYARGYRW